MFRSLNLEIRKLNTSQMIAWGFAILILLGALILWMPFCAAPGEHTTFTDAVFTAATSVCVTGLVTVSTASHWNAAGKTVILLLIQIGGIGVISLASMIFISLHKKMSIRSQRAIQESYNLSTSEGVRQVVKRVLFCVFAAEAAGAVCYAFCFVPEFGLKKGLIQSVFMAVSAFCNAGIDILGEDSLARYVGNPLVNFATMALIIAAGLGFVVWWDVGARLKRVFQKKLSVGRLFRTLRLQTRIVLTMTGVLILAGAALIFFFETGNPRTMQGMPLSEKLMASLFQSVTTRTAGFYTVPQTELSNASVILCLLLMFVGGSPMGTAGGIKTTTLAVLVLSVLSNLKGNPDMEFQNRKIREGYIRSAVVVAQMGVFILILSSILLATAMPDKALTDIVYETASAVGTVGLSRNLTADLNLAGKWIIIVTMYLGRIGPITLGTAVFVHTQKKRRSAGSHLAEEDIMIG